MKNILLTGNGFDLYHGLPTRYSDFMLLAKYWIKFYDMYKKSRSRGVIDAAYPFAVRLDNGKLCLDSLSDFAEHYAAFDEEAIDFLNKKITNNKWIKYFFIYGVHSQNWYDFETEIGKALRNVEAFYSGETSKLSLGLYYKQKDPLAIDTVELFCKGESYAFLRGIRRVSRHEMGDVEKPSHKKRVIEIMLKELDDLNQCLRYYLNEFVCKIKISKLSPDIFNKGNVYLLNFNYTHCYGDIYGETGMAKKHQIHGDIYNNNMVLGISDEAFENTNDYAYFQKYFQRIQKKTGNDYKEWLVKPAMPNISDTPSHVYIFGHSLGKSDDGVLREIFNSDYVEKITIYYHNQGSYENLVFNLVELFGREFVIKETGVGRIEFEMLRDAIVRTI